ncbi:MAG: DUF1461 domain-containing protein [Candidatus Limnocylindrales bacterium]
MQNLAGRLGSLLVSIATAALILAITMPLFLNPVWVGFEQGRAEATAWTGYSEGDLRTATNGILADLVLGPPEFDVAVGGRPVLVERERAHMRDVRGVFLAFFALTGVLVVAALAAASFARRHSTASLAVWRALRRGALGLIAGLVVAGAISFVAFDSLFDVFHRLFFPGGSYTFDPTTDRLVQLFPFAFWQETAIVLGIVSIVIAAVIALVAGRAADDSRQSKRPVVATMPARGSAK